MELGYLIVYDSLKLKALISLQNLKAALVEIQLCSRLEALLLKKKSLNSGDSPELHSEKVSVSCHISSSIKRD